jgi:hypothetical protein
MTVPNTEAGLSAFARRGGESERQPGARKAIQLAFVELRLWVNGGKTPSEYIFSELPQVADIAKSAFHHLASLLVSQITAFWVRAIPAEL